MSRFKFLSAILLWALAGPAALLAQPLLSASFSPSTIGPGSTSTLILTITGTSTPAMDLAFTNSLPAAISIADPAVASTTCDLGVSGTLTAPDGGSTISLSGARISGSESCFVTVGVTASTFGAHSNPAVSLSSSQGNSNSLPVDLTVLTTLPGFSKSFSPSTVPVGDRSTLTFTIDNSLNASRIGTLDFTDDLPAGMLIADPANASTDCISASDPDTTIAAVPGSSAIVLDANGDTIFAVGSEVLPVGATCTVTVDVVATVAGMLDNVTGDLRADSAVAGRANGTLEVTLTALAITQSFVDDPVAPGDTAEVLFNVHNRDRNFAATEVAFTEDLTALVPALAGLTFSSLLQNDCGGNVSGAGGTTIGFSGGTLPAEGSCAIRLALSVPAGAALRSYVATTSTITATIDGSPIVGNMASATLFVEPIPVLTMEFLKPGTLTPDPVINAGDDVVVRYTVTNSSITSGATDIAFQDELTNSGLMTGFLPAPISVTLPPVPNPPCGAGSSVALEFLDSGGERQGLSLTGGSLASAPGAGASCTFDVTLTTPADLAPGIYASTTGIVGATVDGATRLGQPASDTLQITVAPTLTTAFTDDPVVPGGTVTLEFTLKHSENAVGAASAISFTDDLAPVLAGLTANLPATPDPPCGPGSTLSGSGGDTLLTFMGGTVAPGESCTFSVTLDVPAAAAGGSYTNTTSGVSATVGGSPVTSSAAQDDLEVSGVVFTKDFLGDPLVAGETVTLRYVIDNQHLTDDATITFFTDTLSTALAGLAATGGPSVDTCGGALSGTTSLVYVGGSVLSGESCSIEVELLVPAGASDGNYQSGSSSLFTSLGTSSPAVDSLVVNSTLLQLTMQFTDDPVAAGDPVTLEFSLSNLDPSQSAAGISFSDDLGAALSGLTFDSVLFDDCNGTVAGTGTDQVTVESASLAPGATCTLRISLTVPGAAAPGLYTNTTSAVTGTIGGFAVSGAAASDDLEVAQLLLFSKSFDGPTTATGTAVLTFTITNPGSGTAIGIAFQDDLDQVVPGLVATSLPEVPCGEGSSLTGASVLALTGGALPPSGGMCSFDVDVLVPVTAAGGMFPNVTTDLFQSGLVAADPATADLVIEPAPVFTKTFAPDTVGGTEASTLSFTIDNTASSLSVQSLAFVDNFPAGLIVATPANASGTCGGTLTALPDSATLSLAGGSVAAGATCQINVDIAANALGVFVNTTGDLTSSSGKSGTATDTLTVLDGEPPVVTSVSTTDGPLEACDTLRSPIASIQLVFEDNATGIRNADDPMSYRLVEAGPNGDFETTSCTATGGDDIGVTVFAATATSATPFAVEVDARVSGEWLSRGLYRFFVCDSIVDGGGNALDGDGDMVAGGDFSVSLFRTDPFNLFENGQFDNCPVTVDPWTPVVEAPNEIVPGAPGTDDVDASPLSSSMLVANTAAGAGALTQCVPVESGASYELRAALRYTSASSALGVYEQVCDFYTGVACDGSHLGEASVSSLFEDEGGSFVSVASEVQVPGGANSGLCAFAIESLDGGAASLELALDDLFLGGQSVLFGDGFESGDTSMWTAVVP